MSTKVSIIVPVYNTGIYLKECLASLQKQTLKNIEIICVNDGSTDNSEEIIKNFIKNDSRFKLINQPNLGQSSARNNGLKTASGEYIGFVDSDDFVDSKMFENLYNNATHFDSDISMCSITMYNDQTYEKNTNDSYMSLNLFSQSFDNRSFSYEETLDFIFRICVSPCNKIYKNSFIKNNKFRFEDGLSFEDNVFFLDTYTNTKKISLIREPLYFYRFTSNTSCSHLSKHDRKKLDFFKVLELQERILKEKNLYKDIEDYFQKTKKNTLKYWYKKIENNNIKKEFLKKFKEIYGNEEEIC